GAGATESRTWPAVGSPGGGLGTRPCSSDDQEVPRTRGCAQCFLVLVRLSLGPGLQLAPLVGAWERDPASPMTRRRLARTAVNSRSEEQRDGDPDLACSWLPWWGPGNETLHPR